MSKISVSLVDDHPMFRNGMAGLIDDFDGYFVLNQSGNGQEFIEKVKAGQVPEIAILDFQMPVMSGEETALWIKQHMPSIKVLSLSMFDDEQHILRMIKAGARGYILKSSEAEEMKLALDQVATKNFYHSELVSNTLMKNFLTGDTVISGSQLTLEEKEQEFLQMLCTELTYKEIAERLKVTERVVDGYREILFARFHIKTRIGLVLFAIKNDMVRL